MEGKDVLTQILREHHDFLYQVTSIQIGGITYEEMTQPTLPKGSLIKRFMQCEGVYVIEPTYQTESTGQWLLVVDKNKIDTIKKYISDTQAEIYKRRGDKSSPTFRYKESPTTQGYKLVVVDRWTSRVGTYAEALCNRFQSVKPIPQKTVPPNVTDTSTPSRQVRGQEKLTKVNQIDARQSEKRQQNSDEYSKAAAPIPGTPVRTKELIKKQTTDFDTHSAGLQGIDGEEASTIAKQPIRETTDYEKAIQDMEDTFTKKIQEMQSQNSEFIESVENKLNKRVEDILESKFDKISQMVSDSVTSRILKGMANMMNCEAAKESTDDRDRVTKVSQTSQSPSTPIDATNTRPHKPSGSGTKSFSTTELMVQELSIIENSTPPCTDPPHDVQKIGSSVTKQ